MKRYLLVVAAACLSGARAQPISCQEDDQCSSGSYCDAELHFCLPCLSCHNLKREPPTLASKCVKYVSECGPCLQGLVSSVDGTASCVPAESGGLPPYLWALIGLALLLFVVFVIGVLFYILRHTETFKILTSATSVETQRSPHEEVPASAPPPYNGHYEPVRPSSPPPPGHEESSAPLVKRVDSSRASGARESAASQAARVFNNPAYVRGPHLPPADPPSYSEALSDGSDHESPFTPPPDEDTMESVWTPNHNSRLHDTEPNVAVVSTATVEPSAAGAAAAARRSEGAEYAPPAKIHCVREDSNNNRGGNGGEPSSSSGGNRAPSAGNSLVINVLNVNTIRPLNDLSL